MALSTPDWIKQDSALLAQYLAGTITEPTFVSQRAALVDQLALGTPLSAALRADHAITSLNQTIQKWIMVSGVVRLRAVLNDISELPAYGEPGDSYLIGQNLHVWDGAKFVARELRGPMGTKVQLQRNATHIQWRYEDDAAWTDLAAISDFKGDKGDSAFTVWRDQSGTPDATVEDYLSWLKNAQTAAVVAAITPLVDRAEAAEAGAVAARTLSEEDAIAAAASADAAQGFAESTALDKSATAAAVEATAASATAAATSKEGADAARDGSVAAQEASEAAQRAVDATKIEVDAAAVVATDKAAEAAASALAADNSDKQAGAKATTATQAADAANAAKVAAEAARDAASEIVGGDFLSKTEAATTYSTKTESNAKYRHKTDEVALTEVTGLQGALDAKATPADIQAAIDALLAGAPGALDTLFEIAEKFAADDDAMAALMVTVGEKAGQAAVDALTARIAALEAVKPVLTINGTAPDAAGNIIVQTGDVAPSEVVLTRSNGVLTTVTETVDGDPRVTVLTRSNGVLTQTVTTYRGKTTTNTFNRTNGRLTGVTTTEA